MDLTILSEYFNSMLRVLRNPLSFNSIPQFAFHEIFGYALC